MLTVLIFQSKALGFFSTMDTADNLQKGQYSFLAETQFLLSGNQGLNVVAHGDVGIDDQSSFKFVAGTGRTTFQAGGFYKIVPFPDYDNQPGIGGFAGILYGNTNGTSSLHFRFHPLISKKIEAGVGDFTPYISLPFGISATSGSTTYPVQFVLGTKYKTEKIQSLHFWGELGAELNASFTYISLGVSMPFGEGVATGPSSGSSGKASKTQVD